MPVFKFSGKNILIISPESWDYVKVSKHHYAQVLASKNNSVYFVNPPDNSIKGIVCKKVADNLSVIDYKDPFTGVRFLPKAIRKYLNKVLYNNFQRTTQTKFDIVFLFENSRFYDLDFLSKDVLSIYFQVDEDQNFHPARAAKSADLIIAINDVIQEILSKYRTPVFRIPHGFSGHFSANALQILNGEKMYRKPDGRIKAYYVGNLDNGFIDTDLIASLVCKTPDIEFVFIGPYSPVGKLYSLIKDCQNVLFLGQVPADIIPQLLDEADLLFFVYRDEFVSSSHKIMEYLASGKAIVATKVKGYAEDPDLFYCSGSAEKFIDQFNEVCATIEEANSAEKMRKRIQFARDNTYETRIRQIEGLIDKVSTNKKRQ